MKFTECDNCFEQVEAKDFFRKDLGWCCVCPKCGATIKIDDIADFLLPAGTKIKISDGRFGIIDSFRNPFANKFDDIEYEIRLINKNDLNNFTILARRHFEPVSDWRLTERTFARVVKVCHYPRNQDYSNVPCYNCVDRTLCNRDILERLARYEDTGLLPEEIEELKKKIEKE